MRPAADPGSDAAAAEPGAALASQSSKQRDQHRRKSPTIPKIAVALNPRVWFRPDRYDSLPHQFPAQPGRGCRDRCGSRLNRFDPVQPDRPGGPEALIDLAPFVSLVQLFPVSMNPVNALRGPDRG